MLEIDHIDLPAFLASALINGDISGLEDRDTSLLEEIHQWLRVNHWRIVGCADESQLGQWRGLVYVQAPPMLCDMLTYTIARESF